MRASFYTLGCKLNQCETEAISDAFRKAGIDVHTDLSAADIFVVNTCTVTSKSEQKARRMIRKIAKDNPDSLIIVTGCYAELNAAEVAALGPRIAVVPQSDKSMLLDVHNQEGSELREAFSSLQHGKEEGGKFRYLSSSQLFHSRAFLKIQDGCNNRCAYCRVPLARGNSVSLASETVLHRVQNLERAGYSEVVLTGVNIPSYASGSDRLSDLLSAILLRTERIRIRLSSLEPDAVDSRLISVISRPRIRPHFHIPVQSGSDAVLSSMGRHYRAETVAALVDALRTAKDDPFIAADFIVGFPGEGDDEFAETVEFIRSLDFAQLHVFPFSPRPGTRAFAMGPRVPSLIRKKRAENLGGVSEELHRAYLLRWQGKVLEAVLEEQDTHSGVWTCTTANYIKCNIPGVPEGARKGGLCACRITGYTPACTALFVEHIR